MKKNIFKKIILAVVAIVLVFLPYGIFTLYATRQPHVYSQTYYAALVDKVNLLEKNKNQKKIILIGGSTVAFGFNSKFIEDEYAGGNISHTYKYCENKLIEETNGIQKYLYIWTNF